ncbi:KRBBA protein, partial [Climacteris rufus]|nr:KRBBA protein [Climacteris rufus]
EDCGVRGPTLLLPRDRDELEFLNETLQKPTRHFWIGLSVSEAGTGCMWVNSSCLHRDQFQLDLGERPRPRGMIKGDRITSESCSTELRWICQRSHQTL